MSGRTKLREYSSYRRMVKGFLSLGGLWPSEESKLWYRLLPYVQLVLSTMTVIAIINFMVHHIKNVSVVIKVVSLLTSTSIYIFKLCIMIIYREEVLELNKTLHGFFSEIMNDEKLAEFACKKVTICRSLGWSISMLVYATFIFYMVIVPLINILIQEFRHYDDIVYPLVYPTMYPWNTTSDGSPYRITLIVELLTVLSCCNVSAGVDSLLLFWVFQAISQLRAMSYRINHIRKEENYDDTLKKNIVQYGTLIKFSKQLQKIYGPIILYNNGTGATLLCTLIFQLATASALTKVQISRYAVYIMAKTLQVYLYSLPGTLLNTESEKYIESVYFSDWVEQSSSRTAVLITLVQKPLTLKACHLTVVSIEMFAMVMKTSISYYLLLKTMAPDA